MKQDEIIRMAREAGFTEYGSIGYVGMEDYLERFYLLAFAAGSTSEREKLKAPHECQTDGEKTAFAFGWFKAMEQIEAAVLAEREACAKVCDELKWYSAPINFAENCAKAIRARGDK